MDRLLIVLAVLGVVVAAGAAYRRAVARRGLPARLDLADLGARNGASAAAVAFTSPYCLPCQEWEAALGARGVPLLKLDVAARPDLARRYGIHATPVVLAVRFEDGAVLAGYDGHPAPDSVDRVASLVAA